MASYVLRKEVPSKSNHMHEERWVVGYLRRCATACIWRCWANAVFAKWNYASAGHFQSLDGLISRGGQRENGRLFTGLCKQSAQRCGLNDWTWQEEPSGEEELERRSGVLAVCARAAATKADRAPGAPKYTHIHLLATQRAAVCPIHMRTNPLSLLLRACPPNWQPQSITSQPRLCSHWVLKEKLNFTVLHLNVPLVQSLRRSHWLNMMPGQRLPGLCIVRMGWSK